MFVAIAILDFKRVSLRLGALRWLWAGFLLTVFYSLALGIIEIEAGAALQEFRAFLYPFAAISWVLSIEWESERRREWLEHVALVVGWLLVIIAVYHAARFGLGSTGTFVDPNSGIEQTTRSLVSGQALVLLFCIPFALRSWTMSAKKMPLISGVVFALVVLVVQQRTVWAVAIAMVAAFYFSSGGRHRIRGIIAIAVGGWIALVVVTSNVAGDVVAMLLAAANDSDTYNARLSSWQNLVDQGVDKGLGTVLFGAPFGSGYGRFESVGRWVEFAPHNWYVTLFLRVGIVGLALFAIFFLTATVKAFREKTNLTSLTVLIGTLVYCWAYSIEWYTAIFVGWALLRGGRDVVGDQHNNADSASHLLSRGRPLTFVSVRQL